MLVLSFALSSLWLTWAGQTSSTDRALFFAEGFEDTNSHAEAGTTGTASCFLMMRSLGSTPSSTTSRKGS